MTKLLVNITRKMIYLLWLQNAGYIYSGIIIPVNVIGKYEVCSENNGNFLISRVWRVLLSTFFYYVGIHAPEVL